MHNNHTIEINISISERISS